MTRFRFICKQIWQGRSVTRAFFNYSLTKVCVNGNIADIGAGHNPTYHDFFLKAPDVQFVSMDRLVGDTTNFECDSLPYDTGSFETVLSMNVLEHIYNYRWHFSELTRIIKTDGQLVLFVPFLYMYHPDHDSQLLDCFRYTRDALERLATEFSLSDIKVQEVGFGVCTATLNMCLLSLPRIVRLPLFMCAYGIDTLLVKVRPLYPRQFPLGYLLIAKKS